jgi:SAM-dependent methyltransferase
MIGALPEPEPEPEPETERQSIEPAAGPSFAAGRYFDSDFAWEEVVEEGRAAVAAHGEYLPAEEACRLQGATVAAASWDDFYRTHGRRFFKPRSYLLHAFPELKPAPAVVRGPKLCRATSKQQIVVEVGCGAGDTAFSLLQLNPSLIVYASDFSPTAVETMRANPLFAQFAGEGRLHACVWDLTVDDYPSEMAGVVGRCDAVVSIFCLSAIPPRQHAAVARKLVQLLSPPPPSVAAGAAGMTGAGGSSGTPGALLFRDYGLYDLSQIRYKAGRRVSKSFYVRGDSTLCYYFSLEEMTRLWVDAGCELSDARFCRVKNTNRKKALDMKRVFAQARGRRCW